MDVDVSILQQILEHMEKQLVAAVLHACRSRGVVGGSTRAASGLSASVRRAVLCRSEMESVNLDAAGLIMIAADAIGLAVCASVLKRGRAAGAVLAIERPAGTGSRRWPSRL